MLSGIVIGIVVAALVATGWAIDRRAAERREDAAMQDGLFLGRTIGRLSEEAKSEMFADVMASYRERTESVNEPRFSRYTIGMFAFAVTCMVLAGLVWWSL